MTTAATENDIARRIVTVLHDGMRDVADRGPLLNEAATLSLLIRPALEALGYPETHRAPEYGEAGNRLDEACFLNPVTASPGHAAVIVEAKQCGTDFDRTTPGRPSNTSPDRQIQRYLKQHSASGPNTLGVLTDGIKWRIYRRAGSAANPDVEFIVEHNLAPLANAGQAALADFDADVRERLQDLVERLARDNIHYRTVPSRVVERVNPADQLFAAIADNLLPDYILRQMTNEPGAVTQSNINDDANLLGIRKDAHDNDWQAYSYNRGIAIRTENPGENQTLAGRRAVIAAVRFHPSRGLSRPDTALCARIFASADASGTAVVFAYAGAPDSGLEARLAVAAGGQVNMTAAFDPTLPSPSARAAIAQLLQMLHDPDDGLTAEKLLAPLAAATLRQQFYREVAQWTGRMQQGKTLPQRQAVLRHLVRVMFAWILKEENIIPPELFETAFVNASLPDAALYHQDVLRFLFHRRLDTPGPVRPDHHVPAIHNAMESAPFLNGSLFAEHGDDDDLDIAPAEYWNADAQAPGLFTILSRYHWTMDEHRPGESEQTLDPELLSNLFERLITPTEEGTAPPLRQPNGTYYTPADVADEMVKDALAAAVRDYAPAGVADAQLLALFGDADEPLPRLTAAQHGKLTQRIKELRIFDPAVGSGEFLFSMLLALQRALRKLEPDAANPAADIIKRQLAGQDIHPLAVQIARLRLFIAITAARRSDPGDAPLPNLEARIVCADTLQTIADPQWRPDRPGQLDSADPELINALTSVAENRARWFDAHTEDAKQKLLTQDGALRDRLRLLLHQKGELASPELIGFAESPLYNVNPTPARTDARLLFYETPWQGFDIVIGNPPYEALSKSMERAAVNALKTDKRYQTTNVSDLYALFCETALALAKQDGGVVTLIVPLSITFGQAQRTLRNAFESSCRSINLRSYDNIPDTIFNGSPTLKTWKNRQRATIVTAVLGADAPAIKSTGLQGWLTAERKQCLGQRQTVVSQRLGSNIDNRIASQWLRIPTKEVADMVDAIAAQSRTVVSYADASGTEGLAFPQTAYQFIGVIPEGAVSPRRETVLRVKDHDTMCLLMAALNGHVGYAWWWMVGDGFHVKPIADHGTLTIPNICSKNPQQMISLGQRLIDAIPECITEKKNSGTVWRNVNFHRKPTLIEELDRLHIAALGLPEEPLLTHLRIMRSSSSWDYGRQLG